jgi:hypothetical protein
MISVEEKLPERGKLVSVFVNGNKYKATLYHNDWVFDQKSRDKLGVGLQEQIGKKMDAIYYTDKISHWENL